MTEAKVPEYGQGDATYLAVGGESGVRNLVDAFYDIMSTDPEFVPIWQLHNRKSTDMRDRLTRFLVGWMNGPRLYSQKYGQINIPQAHAHLEITEVHRDLWLKCMSRALESQPFPRALKAYLMRELAVPAERILQKCQAVKRV